MVGNVYYVLSKGKAGVETKVGLTETPPHLNKESIYYAKYQK